MNGSTRPRRDFLKFSAAALAAWGASRATTRGAEPRKSAPGIRLIVRGDDMGFSHSGNQALIKCHREGIQTSIEVIAPSPWFPEAVKLLAENSGTDVGVHLALTSEWDNMKWRPLTQCPSLVEPDGYFSPMLRPNKNYPGRALAEKPWQAGEVEAEFRAQIELVKKHVPRVSHVSGHMGCTGLSPAVAALTRRIAKEYGVDIDLDEQGVKLLRYAGPKGTPEEKLANFLKALETMQPGGTYWFIDHPGLDTPELRAISHIGYENVAADRQGVTDTWTHPRVKAFIKERGIQLIGYRDLKRGPRFLRPALGGSLPGVSPLAPPARVANVEPAMKISHTLALMSLCSLLSGFARAEALKVGDKAPAVSATTDAGTTLNLADVYKKNDYTLVWFYPRALTGGCTKQGCSLRDASVELKKKGVAVVGVSTDPVEKQKEFKEVNNFPFPLLADTDKKVIKAFGQAGTGNAAREAYLIDRSGKVVYHDEKQTDKQAEKVLEFLNAKKS